MDKKMAENTEDMTALKDFLLDIECLGQLSEWTSKFNLFDILKISRSENRHSDMLAWLLNPNENHGLGDSVLHGFIQFAVENADLTQIDVFKTLLMSCHNFLIYRERYHIDILAVSNDEKFVLCIENKIGSDEHDKQLKRYREELEKHYSNYKKIYIYLSPYHKYELSDPDNWCSMGYDDVLDIIDNACKKTKLRPDAELLINNYIDTIRNYVMENNTDLEQICREIYAKHQKALDLIFEYRPDSVSELTEIFREWATEKQKNGELNYIADKSNNTHTRFTTETMSKILPDAKNPTSFWKTRNYYFYEIYNNNGKTFIMYIVLNSTNMPENLEERCKKIFKLEKNPSKTNWKWFRLFTTTSYNIDENKELSKKEIFKQLNNSFKELQKKVTELYYEKLKQDLPQ